MIITYQGDNYFKLQAGATTVLIDPTNQRSFKGANLIINTLKPPLAPVLGEGDVVWIEHQGEYEAKGVAVRGWSNGLDKDKEKTIYRLTIDDLAIGVLGYSERMPSEDIQEYLADVDIILGPAAKAASWVKQLEPAIVIPALKGKELESYLKELGAKQCEEMEKLTVKKKDLTSGKIRVVCLKV